MSTYPCLAAGTSTTDAPGMFSRDKVKSDTERLVPLLERDKKYPKAHRIFRRVRAPENHLLWPGIQTLGPDGSLDAKYIQLKELMHRRLSSSFPVSSREGGVLDENCIPRNFNSCFSVGGWPMQDLGYVACDNTSRSAQGWESGRHKEIARNVARLAFRDWEPNGPLRLSKLSSVGLPTNDSAIAFKKTQFMRNAANMEEIDRWFAAGKLQDLFKKYQIVAGSSIGYRYSNDAAKEENGRYVPKDRSAPDFDVARGVDKEVPIADRSVRGDDRFYAQRTRPFHAQPGSLNHMHQAVIKGFQDAFVARYEDTYKVRSREELLRIWKGKYFFGLDAGQFDQSYAPFVLEEFFDVMRDYVEPYVVDALELQVKMPIFSPSPKPGVKGHGVWLGNPFNIDDFKLRVGVPSGICIVSFINKWWGTCISLFAMDDLTKDVMGKEDELLRTAHPRYQLANNGDDGIVGSKSKVAYTRLLAHIEKEGSPYCNLEIEDAIRYGGTLLYHSKDGVKAAPDCHTYVDNWWSPERGLNPKGGHFRTEPELAWVARRHNFMDHPRGGDLHEIVISAVFDVYGINIDEEVRGVKPPTGTELYALVADKPSVLQWMDIEIPDYIADKYTASIQLDEYAPLVRNKVRV